MVVGVDAELFFFACWIGEPDTPSFSKSVLLFDFDPLLVSLALARQPVRGQPLRKELLWGVAGVRFLRF
jgi:hypothetical protein